MGGLRWTRKTTENLSRQLRFAGIEVSPRTVGRLLAELGFALRVNYKKHARRGQHPDRNRQFEYIASQRRAFKRRKLPVISVDSKKKELRRVSRKMRHRQSTFREQPLGLWSAVS